MHQISRRQALSMGTGAAAAGTTLWSYRLGAEVADVTASGDVVYALDTYGGVYALRI